MTGLAAAKQMVRIVRAATLHDRLVYAHYGVTHRCDLRCRMCGIWKHGNRKEELNLDQVARVADVLQELGVVQLSIGGGEPFCRDDLDRIVHLFTSRDIQTRVLTNAMNLTESRMERVVDAGLQAVSISLDSLSRKRVAWICGDERGWDKVVTNMVRFARLLSGRGGILVMNTVVSRENLSELPDLVRFADYLGYFISFLPVELAEDAQDASNRFIAYQPRMALSARDAAEVDRAYDQLIMLKAGGAPILSTTPFLVESRAYLKSGTLPNRCDAGTLYLSISPSGQMSLCHRGVGIKSMLDPDIVDHLRSSAFQRMARREVAACSGCIRPCWMDTSKVFRTTTGFFEMVRTAVKARTRRSVPDLEGALAWGRP